LTLAGKCSGSAILREAFGFPYEEGREMAT